MAETEVPRPLPKPTTATEGFWEAARKKELAIQRCSSCDAYRHYPQAMCPGCHSLEWEWTPVSGRGVIHSYTVAHQPFHPHWADKVPYVLATIELEEGVRMVDDMLDLDPEEVRIGLPVEVYFEPVSDEITFPKFRVTSEGS
jgi:uncharacterized OB-fold protein